MTIGRPTAVGMYPQGVSPVGALDLIGSVWEFCLNEYDKPQKNVVLAGRARRVERGGSWGSFQDHASAAYCGFFFEPAYRDSYVGFCVACSSPIRDTGH